MDQSRPDNPPTQQQNVHLHMHHVCNCQTGIYPPAAAAAAAYYPAAAVGYRSPVPQLMPFAAPARPYLQHYQYTQFNVGGQYALPLTHVSPQGAAVYGGVAAAPAPSAEMLFNPARAERREREAVEDAGEDRVNEPPLGYDYGQVTPPANELLMSDNSDSASTENFVKFLERSCLTAEQIAYRNRNRPCFRNIQNLCIRTRSEILKPCTTLSNIHSQGIPWATKDFIYAFVRLTNCWHILKGYWENRDGSSLGKIEKELTPEFRACYVRWEKETIDLAAQLTRVFYNLDTNLNCPATNVASPHTANNLIPPQVNILKSSASENAIKKPLESEVLATSVSLSNTSKNVRGILHLPSAAPAETVDQGNQTCADFFLGDFGKEGFGSEEEDRRIYMKPGSYCVPKKSSNETVQNSPRAIEFLETAQNVNKARDNVNEKYWMNMNIANKNSVPSLDPVGNQQDPNDVLDKSDNIVDIDLNLSSHLNVHEWLISNNFSQFSSESSPQTPPQDLRPYFLDPGVQYDAAAEAQKSPITLLQRGGGGAAKSSSPTEVGVGNRAAAGHRKRAGAPGGRKAPACYETKSGVSELGAAILEKIVMDLIELAFGDGLLMEIKNEYSPVVDMDVILKKIRTHDYVYVSEAIRDLRYYLYYSAYFSEHMETKAEMLKHKLEIMLNEHFPECDFQEVKGDVHEKIGPLKLKKMFDQNDPPEFI